MISYCSFNVKTDIELKRVTAVRDLVAKVACKNRKLKSRFIYVRKDGTKAEIPDQNDALPELNQ